MLRLQSMKRWITTAILTLLIIPPLLLFAWCELALRFTYSSGERAGFVQKISRKGWLCKTWEGELAMSTIPGTVPQLFDFSVRDEAVAATLESRAGQRVSLSYDQHVGIPTSCFGETQYFITRVTPVIDSPAVPTLPVTAAPPAVPPK